MVSKGQFTIESPVAQWLENPSRSRRVVGSNSIGDSVFSEFSKHLIYHVFVVSSLIYSLWRLVGCILICFNVTA